MSLVVTFTMRYLNKKSTLNLTPNSTGEFQLRMNKLYYYLGLICISLTIFAIVICLINIEGDDKWIAIIGFASIFGALGMICYLWYINYYVILDSKYIITNSVLNKRQEIEWDKIARVSFSNTSGLLTFYADNHMKVKVHMHIVGFNEVLNSMERNTKFRKKDLKVPNKA